MNDLTIVLNNVKVDGDRISYDFSPSNELAKYFNNNEQFFIEYDLHKLLESNKNMALQNVPSSILVIPFMCNVLPIAWVLDATIQVEELDKTFYESIPKIKDGYIKMYPRVDFKGKILCGKIVDNNKYNNNNPINKNLMLFSGGVDAFNTLVSHYTEKPTLITLWGSDVFFNDIEGWNNVKNHVEKTAKQFELDYVYIKTNFRKFLNCGTLAGKINGVEGGWWYGIQHGIGVSSHCAPVAYLCNAPNVYMASSYSIKDNPKITCASDPTIEGRMEFGSSNVIHDGFEFTRQDKICNICTFSKTKNIPINLRVCWASTGGKNCCNCEKCYRTTLEIISEGYDPNKFDLFYNKELGEKIKKDVFNMYMDNHTKHFWKDIQKAFLQNKKNIRAYPELKWILHFNFDKISQKSNGYVYNFCKKVYKKLKKIAKRMLRL